LREEGTCMHNGLKYWNYALSNMEEDIKKVRIVDYAVLLPWKAVPILPHLGGYRLYIKYTTDP
jgi:hypothetical protein